MLLQRYTVHAEVPDEVQHGICTHSCGSYDDHPSMKPGICIRGKLAHTNIHQRVDLVQQAAVIALVDAQHCSAVHQSTPLGLDLALNPSCSATSAKPPASEMSCTRS